LASTILINESSTTVNYEINDCFFLSYADCIHAKAQESNKWVSLFDGKTLSGWHSFKNPGMTPSWTVKDDAIYLDVTNKQGRGDLSDRQVI
jgi:hypothetical protein